MYKLRTDARDRFVDARVEVVITFGCRGVALNAMVSGDTIVECRNRQHDTPFLRCLL